MSETIIIAIIGVIGSILGALIGAFATIRAADIRAKAGNNDAARNSSRGIIGLVASIAAVFGLVIASVFATILLQQLGYSQPQEQIVDGNVSIIPTQLSRFSVYADKTKNSTGIFVREGDVMHFE